MTNKQYVVSGLIRRGGIRCNISNPMTLLRADALLKDVESMLKIASPRNKWVSELQINKYGVGCD